MPRRLTRDDARFEADFAALLADREAIAGDVAERVAAIIAEVRQRGDDALVAFTRRFDRLRLEPRAFAVTAAERDAAAERCAPDTLAALNLAAERISDHHRRQRPDDLDYRDAAGVRLGHRWRPVSAAGLYVPGGTAAYPSSVLMTALPAKVAGVERLAMAVPAPDGVLDPLVLAAAKIAGVDEIYKLGGAQAVAALAYGTETVRPVDKIVGPGNAYVAEAKRQVFGTVGIDAIAGPSEVLVVADGDNDPAWIAADLMAQAEHDVAAQALLITDDAGFAEAVERAVQVHLQRLPRGETARRSWDDHGAVILVSSLADAPPLVDRVAPEHLELAVAEPDALADRISHAGAIFLGRHTPEAIGDYLAGPNHVLPTARGARFASGLSVFDFLKRSSLIACDADSLARIGPPAATLARAEGLGAHALSIDIRLAGRGGSGGQDQD